MGSIDIKNETKKISLFEDRSIGSNVKTIDSFQAIENESLSTI